jgi:YHS domain-containing protein
MQPRGQQNSNAPRGQATPPKSRTATAAPPLNREPTPAPPSDDNFVDPFENTPAASRDNDTLDLDALIEEPVSPLPLPVSSSTTAGTARPGDSQITDSDPTPASALPVDAPAEAPDITASSQPLVTPAPEPAADDVIKPGTSTTDNDDSESVALEQNPFTDVRLPVAGGVDDAAAEPAPATPDITPPVDLLIDAALDADDPASGSDLTVGSPLPMSDFGSDLPAIPLPAVDDLNTPTADAVPAPTFDAPASGAGAAGMPLPDAPADSGLDLIIPGETAVPAASPANSEMPDLKLPAVEAPAPVATPAAQETERLQQHSIEEHRKQQLRQIAARASQPGFKGFCPVALRDRRELIDSEPEFTATFGLQTYSFHSLDAKLAFEAEPTRYAPAAGGADVVVLVNSGEEKAGSLDHALWHRDRLYLFSSRETMTQFSRDPQRFASQY